MSTLQIPSKLKPFLTKKKRFKIAIGGRGSAKSTSFANVFLMKTETEAADVLCLREFQNSIDDSVHKLMKKQIDKLGINDRFMSTDKKIECISNGAGTRYKGASRNSGAIKSAEGYKYAWFEEAQTISENTLEVLLPTIREEGSELWFSANPMSANDPFSKRFIVPYLQELEQNGYYEDDLHIIIVINWRDNPWFPVELEEDRKWDFENLSRAKYDHIWEGKFDDSIDKAIIQAEWFDAAIDAHKKLGIKPSGVEVVAHDPSDEGEDAKGIAYRHGIVIMDADAKETGDINEGGDWAADHAIMRKADVFTWDCDGMGIGLNRQFENTIAVKKIDLAIYKGSEAPRNPKATFEEINGKRKTNEEVFLNKRAQAYWLLRERFRKTYLAVTKGEYQNPDDLISINSNIEKINAVRSELCRIPTVDNGAGKIQIMSKKEMKKNKIPSPNMADSIVMAMYYEHVIIKKKKIHVNPTPIKNHWR